MSTLSPSITDDLDDDLDEDEGMYPSGDGKPMAETPVHVDAIILLLHAFQDFLALEEDTYIGANMFWYFEEGNPKARRAPDVMVIKGVGRRERKSLFSWLENGAVPSVIVEVVSPKKRRSDLKDKPQLYARLGVSEYFCFDPNAKRPKEALQGWRLNAEGIYEALELDDQGRLFCQELGLYLKADGKILRLIDAATGKVVMTRQERADWQHQQVIAERQRAEAEKQRAEAEKQRAEAEKQRADALEGELARLKAQKKQ